MLIPKIRVFPLLLVLFSLMLNQSGARAQSDREESGVDVAAPIEPLPPDIDESSLFSELLAHNELRNAALAGYTDSITTVRSLLRTTHWNFLASSRLGRIVAFSYAQHQNGRTNICLKGKFGLIPRTLPSSELPGIPRRNFHSGSNGSNSCASTKRSTAFGFRKKMRHTCKSECMGRRFSRSTIRITS